MAGIVPAGYLESYQKLFHHENVAAEGLAERFFAVQPAGPRFVSSVGRSFLFARLLSIASRAQEPWYTGHLERGGSNYRE